MLSLFHLFSFICFLIRKYFYLLVIIIISDIKNDNQFKLRKHDIKPEFKNQIQAYISSNFKFKLTFQLSFPV
jgi:hypothetical protein